jgi:hypothetical protein
MRRRPVAVACWTGRETQPPRGVGRCEASGDRVRDRRADRLGHLVLLAGGAALEQPVEVVERVAPRARPDVEVDRARQQRLARGGVGVDQRPERRGEVVLQCEADPPRQGRGLAGGGDRQLERAALDDRREREVAVGDVVEHVGEHPARLGGGERGGRVGVVLAADDQQERTVEQRFVEAAGGHLDDLGAGRAQRVGLLAGHRAGTGDHAATPVDVEADGERERARGGRGRGVHGRACQPARRTSATWALQNSAKVTGPRYGRGRFRASACVAGGRDQAAG